MADLVGQWECLSYYTKICIEKRSLWCKKAKGQPDNQLKASMKAVQLKYSSRKGEEGSLAHSNSRNRHNLTAHKHSISKIYMYTQLKIYHNDHKLTVKLSHTLLTTVLRTCHIPISSRWHSLSVSTKIITQPLSSLGVNTCKLQSMVSYRYPPRIQDKKIFVPTYPIHTGSLSQTTSHVHFVSI